MKDNPTVSYRSQRMKIPMKCYPKSYEPVIVSGEPEIRMFKRVHQAVPKDFYKMERES